MLKIRKATPQDAASAAYICIQTASGIWRKNQKTEKIASLLFSNYYITHENENCFVLTEGSAVVGYILCSADLRRFLKSYRGDTFKAVAALSPLWGVACLFLPAKYVLLHRRYPAHLHIDILQPYQSAGYGSRLMETLLSHLKAQGIKGVCLSCGADNTRAIRFYKKYGFTSKLTAFGGKLMVKKL